MKHSGERKPTAGYLFTLGVGLTGVVFTTIAVEATSLKQSGLDPSDTFNNGALYAMGVAAIILFGFRLIFAKQASVGTQNVIRAMVTLFMAALLLGSLAAALYVFTAHPGDTSTARPTMVIALLTQLATTIWLLRFRTE